MTMTLTRSAQLASLHWALSLGLVVAGLVATAI